MATKQTTEARLKTLYNTEYAKDLLKELELINVS